LNVAISASGILLPFQMIWAGKTHKSLPDHDAPGYAEAIVLQFLFEVSGITNNYWSTLATMMLFVMKILIPYFKHK
jgi:hypothetical protein